jgi:hypothetical protein
LPNRSSVATSNMNSGAWVRCCFDHVRRTRRRVAVSWASRLAARTICRASCRAAEDGSELRVIALQYCLGLTSPTGNVSWSARRSGRLLSAGRTESTWSISSSRFVTNLL